LVGGSSPNPDRVGDGLAPRESVFRKSIGSGINCQPDSQFRARERNLRESDGRSDAPTRRGAWERAQVSLRAPGARATFLWLGSCRIPPAYALTFQSSQLTSLGIGDTFGFTVNVGQLDVPLVAEGEQLDQLREDVTPIVFAAGRVAIQIVGQKDQAWSGVVEVPSVL
jgi:hypothetical protein